MQASIALPAAQQAAKGGLQIAAGEWKSLSMELVFAQQVMRWTSHPPTTSEPKEEK